VGSYFVFRRYVRQDYQQRGQLSIWSSMLELLVFVLFMGFPYLYNPPSWAWIWLPNLQISTTVWLIGLALVIIGLLFAFGTMAWFGLRRAFGLLVTTLMQIGPYRITRNPQIVGGALMVLGEALIWPSGYSVLWIALYGWIAHLMVITEEEHLLQVFGEEYKKYCAKTPRYLGVSNPK
jgi:protein-S-isoprenylcysteine O-methyltransferase Ste14